MADVTNVKVGQCDVNFNDVDLGHTKGGVEVTYEPAYFEASVDAYGDTPIEKYLTGERLTAKVPLAEFTLANMGIAIPQGQFAGAADARRTIGAKAGKKASDDAYELVLHPSNEGTRVNDVVLYKAVVDSTVVLPHRKDEERIVEVTFVALIDESKSDGNYLGMIGDSTA